MAHEESSEWIRIHKVAEYGSNFGSNSTGYSRILNDATRRQEYRIPVSFFTPVFRKANQRIDSVCYQVSTFLYKPEERLDVGGQVEDGEEGRGWLLYDY